MKIKVTSLTMFRGQLRPTTREVAVELVRPKAMAPSDLAVLLSLDELLLPATTEVAAIMFVAGLVVSGSTGG